MNSAMETQQPQNNDVEMAWSLDTEELYRRLGIASLGTESMSESDKAMNFLLDNAINTDSEAATESLLNNLLKKGKAFFQKVWQMIKKGVCQLYQSKTPVAEGKDLVQFIVAALKNLSNIEIMVVTIAVRIGLNALCK